VAGNGHLRAFGIDLADTVRSAGNWGHKAPFIILILVAVALQYIQMRQINGRNPAAAAANPQLQTMQRVMPVIFAFIYINIPAGVNVYFIVSSLFRIGQQDGMYRWDPNLKEAMDRLRKNTSSTASTAAPSGKGLLARFREAAGVQESPATNGNSSSHQSAAYTPPRVKPANRSKNKKQRRSR
jgi:YidC/Oxa1 family membrane protein insertase